MVEEPEIGMDHGDQMIVTGLDDTLVVVGSSWRGDILHTALKEKKHKTFIKMNTKR